MSAWLEELGREYHHVMRFQAMAPSRAAATMASVVVASSTSPDPMVLATAVPANAPRKLNAAAMSTATWGRRARVATDVAMAFASVVEAVDVVEQHGQDDDHDKRERQFTWHVGPPGRHLPERCRAFLR